MRRIASVILACAMVLAMLLSATAYAANTTKLNIAQIRQEEGNLYLYLTGVNDRGEAALETLTPRDYAVSMNGTGLEVTSVVPFSQLAQKETTHYVVCVDVSLSIGGSKYTKDKNEREEVRAALKSMIEGMRANERMSVYTFGNTVQEIVKFKKNDSNSLAKVPETLKFDGNYTALYDVINKATNLARSYSDQAPRNAVVIITDGTDDPGAGGAAKYNFNTILEDVRKRNVPVYIATFYRRENNDGKESLSQLQQLAEISGGEYYSLGSFEEGYRMPDVLTNLLQLTRESTRLTAQLHSDLEHGDGTFKVSMTMQSGTMDSLEHSFGVNWGAVPPPPDLTLDKLEVGEVTEDSTSIHVDTEPGATVTFKYGKKSGSITVDASGEGEFDFSNWLSDSFSIEQNHTFTVTAKDANGNSTLPDGKEARKTIKVGESSRKEIVVTDVYGTDANGVQYAIDKEGMVYGDKLTVKGSAQGNTQVTIGWVPDRGEPVSSGPIYTTGMAYNYTFQADGVTLGPGSVVVKYSDNTALGKQGYYPGTINWVYEKPVEMTVDLRSALSEDSQNIELKTTPGAEIHVMVNGAEVNLDGNNKADEKGNWVYPLANNDRLRLKNDTKVKIRAVDPVTGTTTETEEISVGKSSRRYIVVNMPSRLDEETGAYYGKTLKITGNAERGVYVRVNLMDADTNEILQNKDVPCSGKFAVEFSAEECNIPEDEGKKCYVSAEYADGLGESAFDSGEMPFTWFGHEQVELELEVKRLLEDSEAITVKTNPGVWVTVLNRTSDRTIESHKADQSTGMFTCSLTDLEDELKPCEGDEIRVIVEDEHKTQKYTDITVGPAKRNQITVEVNEARDASNGVIESESITVQGHAERDQEVTVIWMPDGSESTSEQTTTKVSANGWYEVKLNKEGFTEGSGTVEVRYADGLAQSKTGGQEVGRIKWVQKTPVPQITPEAVVTVSPTDTPAPTDTPVPTYTPTPSPEPTKPPFFKGVVNNFTDYFGGPNKMLKDWRFWALTVAALLLVALIVLAIVLLVRKAKKNKGMTTFTPSDDIQREGELAEAGTERQKAPGGGGSTKRMGFDEGSTSSSGTVNLSQSGLDFGFDSNSSSGSGSGTIRLSPENAAESGSGTVRISQSMGPQPMVVRIHESRDWAGVSQDVTLSIISEAYVGRNDGNDLVIQDETVSGRHMKLTRRENNLFAQDLMSSNGTQLNGQRITIETQLTSGDVLTLGRTKLRMEFDA